MTTEMKKNVRKMFEGHVAMKMGHEDLEDGLRFFVEVILYFLALLFCLFCLLHFLPFRYWSEIFVSMSFILKDFFLLSISWFVIEFVVHTHTHTLSHPTFSHPFLFFLFLLL